VVNVNPVKPVKPVKPAAQQAHLAAKHAVVSNDMAATHAVNAAHKSGPVGYYYLPPKVSMQNAFSIRRQERINPKP
jgi:hypothetical protein